MIEKLKVYEETPSGYKHPENMIQEKINEIVDAVNKLHTEAENNAQIRANHEHEIDELKKETITPYSEQIKWIGCLVEFNTDSNVFGNSYGILTGIRTDGAQYPFIINEGEYHAWSVRLPDDSLIYKNEKGAQNA